jgi:hypothetical protein
MVEDVAVTLFDGSETLEVVGESHYADNLRLLVDALAEPGHYGDDGKVRVPIDAILVADTDNQYDLNSISLWVSGHKVGHLSRHDAAAYRPGLLNLQVEVGQQIALEGQIIGRDGIYGVFLKHDPEDFGVMARDVGMQSGELRTGLTEALWTNDDDDSYDLSWMDTLPSDTAKRISKLRKLLEDDPDPIDRHFMFTQLEKDLYSCRDLWPTALDEYDEVAEQHHAEMTENMRAALFDKFGELPLIDTYKQGAIRQQKARDWDASLLWAERGLEVYGDDAARPEAVEDLKKRADRAKSRLDR